jgi:lysophospholipid acyltransferase (LPLAT)-like uncharacterized protein
MRARHPWWLPLAAVLGAGVVRAIGATWRFTVSDAPEYSAALARGERFVYAFWHSALLPLAVLHRHEGIAVLVSRHRDGELITRIIERLGFVAARGSSTRGGEAGVRGMLAWAGQDRHLAVTPDGPRGPAEQVKPGALYLAERTGRRMVPIGVAADRTRAFRSWDRFRVPWPFARVLVSHGAPFAPPHSLTAPLGSLAGSSESGLVANSAGSAAAAAEAQVEERDLEPARLAFERALDTLTRDVRVRVGERI